MNTIQPTTLSPLELTETTLSPLELKDTSIEVTSNKTKSVDGRASDMFQSLFAGQLEVMARQLATAFDIDVEAAVEMANAHAMSIDLKQVAKPTRKSRGKTRKPNVQITPENRCMARVWGSGDGNDQCKCARGDNEYCSRHSKQASICNEPCQLDESGKKKGLFCGRIDQFQHGTTLAPFMDGNEIRIEWNSIEHKEAITKGIETDSIHHRNKTKKSKKTPSVVEVNEQELVELMTDGDSNVEEKTCEVVNNVEESATIDSLNEAMISMEEINSGETKVSVVEANRRASIAGHETRIEELQQMVDTPKVDEEVDEEESLDVEEWEHNGNSYLVCRDTLVIYNTDGEETGKWGEAETIDAAVPEEE